MSNRKLLFALMANKEPFQTPEQRQMQGTVFNLQLPNRKQNKKDTSRHPGSTEVASE